MKFLIRTISGTYPFFQFSFCRSCSTLPSRTCFGQPGVAQVNFNSEKNRVVAQTYPSGCKSEYFAVFKV